MLYVTNEDKPGLIGRLGTLLGKLGINIANFNLGRVELGEDAIALLSIDGDAERRAAGPDRGARRRRAGQAAGVYHLSDRLKRYDERVRRSARALFFDRRRVERSVADCGGPHIRRATMPADDEGGGDQMTKPDAFAQQRARRAGRQRPG